MMLPDGGRGVFAVVYIDNLVDGIMLAISSEAAAGHIFTLGDAKAVTCAEYFGRLAAMAGGKVRTMPAWLATRLLGTVGAVQRRLGVSSELSVAMMLLLNRPGAYSIEKARTMLGYEPLVSFDEGMRRSEEWARAEGLI